jgi:hypothetical protein
MSGWNVILYGSSLNFGNCDINLMNNYGNFSYGIKLQNDSNNYFFDDSIFRND